MRLFPDKNFKSNYKQRYAANYERLSANRKRRQQERADRTFDTKTKQTVIGALCCLGVIVVLLIVGVNIYCQYLDREAVVRDIETQIESADEDIRRYQVIASSERVEQLKDAVATITNLQTQYLTEKYDSNFEALSERYLGSYNTNWSVGKANSKWVGYLDLSDCDAKSAKGLFVLSCDNIPCAVVVAVLETDATGNFVKISNIQRTEF